MGRRSKRWVVTAFVSLAVAFGLAAQAPTGTAAQGPAEPSARKPDVIYVPTPQEVVDRMLELAEVGEGDVLYDLGCGDGRIVVTAAKRYGVRAVGFDIDPKRVAEARENVRKNGVGHLVTIQQQDIFTADFRDATVVTLFLLPNLNLRLRPKLAALRPGTRIVSHAFPMRGAKPKRVEKVRVPGGREKMVYLWVVPWETEGRRTVPPRPGGRGKAKPQSEGTGTKLGDLLSGPPSGR
jgi:SAM-dependent methyltransferase